MSLFRKPTKVARPCTAASVSTPPPCCEARPPSAFSSTDKEAIVELVKQRAFLRKPSFLQTSPSKKASTRRAIVPRGTTTSTTTTSTKPSAASRTFVSSHRTLFIFVF
jgi:hypothetical protein